MKKTLFLFLALIFILCSKETKSPKAAVVSARIEASKIGVEILKRVESDLSDLGAVEQFPKMEGRQLTMVIAPKKKN